MSALLLLAAAFAVIIAVGSVAVAVNDAVEAWLLRAQERPVAGGGGFGHGAERSRQPVRHGGGRGLTHPPALAVRARRRGANVERRAASGSGARRAGGTR